MAAERYLSRRIPDLRVGNKIDEIDKKLIPASIHPCDELVMLMAKIFFVLFGNTCIIRKSLSKGASTCTAQLLFHIAYCILQWLSC